MEGCNRLNDQIRKGIITGCASEKPFGTQPLFGQSAAGTGAILRYENRSSIWAGGVGLHEVTQV